ncbi:MAG: E3 binding domain-containing protein [Akkermansia sp.]|nr:E3 binding domain-containing protein [Akkermansia sp.]
MKISSLAAKICKAKGINPATLTGTGPGGRIMAADVKENAPQKRDGATAIAEFAQLPTRPEKDNYYVYDTEVDMAALGDISLPIAVQCEKLLENRYSVIDYIVRAVVKAGLSAPTLRNYTEPADVLIFENSGEKRAAVTDAAKKNIYKISREAASGAPIPPNYTPTFIVCDAHTSRACVAAHVEPGCRPLFAFVDRGNTPKEKVRAGAAGMADYILSYTFYVHTSIPEAEANGVAANLHAMLYNPVRLLLLS